MHVCVCVAAEMKENISDRVRGAEELKSKGKMEEVSSSQICWRKFRVGASRS